MTPQTFRKKPVEIQAWQTTAENLGEVANWCGGHNAADLVWDHEVGAYVDPDVGGGWFFAPFQTPGLIIHTLEGDHFAEVGDWILRGVKGEFCPCKPDIFAATYEVGDGANPQTPGVVVGYKQQQTQAAIDAVNHTKTLENELGDWIAKLRADDSVSLDPDWARIAVTHLQQGFMALNRAVFQPESRLG